MKYIIGGLLVVSLLSRPAVLKIDYVAYEILKAQQKVMYVMLKEDEEKKEKPIKVDNMIEKIGHNTKNITSLLKEKTQVVDRIKTMLDFRAITKSPMTENQINSFMEFKSFYESEGGVLKEALNKIDSAKDLKLVKNEILHNDTDYDFVISELKTLTDHQSHAICSLNSIIECGQKTLSML